MDINTCFETTNTYHTIAYYSHVIPVFLALLLSIYVLVKTGFSKLSIYFSLFTGCFSLWLVGDLVTWVSTNYSYVYYTWSWLDYLNILFFALGACFFGILARSKITNLEMFLVLVFCIPGFLATLFGNSVTDFYQPACEVFENNSLTLYKLISEGFFVLMTLHSFFLVWPKADRERRIQLSTVLFAILLFFGVFSSTEYLATITNVYETNLYGLFVLPLFLIVMVFAITNLGIFKIRFLGTQLLVYTLIIMIGSQFLFLESSTDAVLNVITLIVTIFFSLILLRNTKKELEARIQVEKLAGDLGEANTRLKELDRQKTEFVGFASHQLRSPLTPMKGYASLILEGDYGPVSDDIKKAAKIIYDSTRTLASVVDDYLNVSRIELGQMKYEYSNFDFKELVQSVVDELGPNVKSAGLSFVFESSPGNYNIRADKEKIKQVISNIIDNSVKYTPHGGITLTLENKAGIIRFSVKDTGIGIAKDVIPKLFSKFSRAANASQTNTRGTGLGLFIAKEIIVAHHGKIWVESEGDGKGSAFIIELDPSKKL